MILIPYKRKLDEEFASLKDNGNHNYYNVRSVIVSVILIIYTFVALGLSIDQSNRIMLILMFSFKFFIFIVGIMVHYLNFYSLRLQAKLKTSIKLVFAYLLAFASLGYFIVVAFLTFSELFHQI